MPPGATLGRSERREAKGIREFWTTDKDFHRFPGIAVRNPFAADAVHETRVRHGRRASAHRSAR